LVSHREKKRRETNSPSGTKNVVFCPRRGNFVPEGEFFSSFGRNIGKKKEETEANETEANEPKEETPLCFFFVPEGGFSFGEKKGKEK
jgi:hypothetical protein